MKLHLLLLPSYPSKLLPFLPSLTSANSIRPFAASAAASPRGLFLVRCNSSNEGGNDSIRNYLSGMVDSRVEELLYKEENKALLGDLEKASLRVEAARKELESIKRQELEAVQMKDYLRKLEIKASEMVECQRELLEARTMVEEAELSLSRSMEEVSSVNASVENETQEIDRDLERVESIKAGAVSALVGTLAGVPISLSQATSSAELILHLSIIFISCTLFGFTFRYAMRRDLDNIQLKTGTSAAFAFTKGLAEVETGQRFEFTSSSILSHAVDGAVHISENLFVFIFAAISLDYCFKTRLVSPFPIRKMISKSNSGQ